MLNHLRLLHSGLFCGLIATCLLTSATGDNKQSEAHPLISGLRGPMHVREANAEALVALGAGAVEPLIQELKDADPNYRALVAALLGEIGDNRAVEPLKGLLGDKDYTVRAMAATALGRIGDPSAVKPLMKLLAPPGIMLDSNQEYVAVHASYAMAMIGEPAADPLIELLRNYSGPRSPEAQGSAPPTGRESELAATQAGAQRDDKPAYLAAKEAMAAILALGEMRETRAIPELIGILREGKYFSGTAGEALAKIGQPAIGPMLDAVAQSTVNPSEDDTRKALAWIGEASMPAIVDGLKSKNSQVREVSATVLHRALRRIDYPPGADALVAALDNPDVRARDDAESALGDLRDPRTVEPLIALLKDRRSRTAGTAARILGRIGDPRAVEPLIASLQYLSNPVNAVNALEEIGDNRAARALLPGLTDRDPGVRAAAGHALGVMRCTEAVKPLIGLLGDNSVVSRWDPPVPAVKWIAAEALGNIGDKSAVEPIVALLKDRDRAFSWLAAEALARLKDPRAVKLLIGELNDRRSWVNEKVARALGDTGDGAAVAPLVAKLADFSDGGGVPSAAAEALVRLGPDMALAGVVKALADKDWRVRALAARALGGMADPRAVKPLGRALKDNDQRVILSAAAALGNIPGRASIGELASVLDSEDHFVRCRVLISLGKAGDPSCTDELAKHLDDRDVARYAAAALGRIKDPRAVPPLIEHIESEGVAQALGAIGDARAVDPLVDLLRIGGAETRTEAAWALARFKDARAVEPLIVLLRDGDPAVRAVAAGALGQIGDARAVEPLLEELKYKGPYVRGLVRASAAHGDARVVCMVQPGLIPMVVAPNLVSALGSTAQWSDPDNTSFLTSVFNDLERMPHDAYTHGVEAYGIGEYKACSRGAAGYSAEVPHDSHAADAMLAALNDVSPYVHAHAFMALCKIADPRFADAVVDALRNDPAGFSAAWGLRGFKDSRVCSALIEASNDPRPETRVMALLALAQTEDRRATDRVRKAMTDDSSRFVKAVLSAASAKGGKALDAGQSAGQ